MQVISIIFPIFSVVLLGWFARRRGFMPQEFLGPANQLVFNLAIPALIFNAVSKASFRTDFNATVLLVTLLSATTAYLASWLIARLTRWQPKRIGAFIQCSSHGNHGYIGLPIAFYFIGESGFAKTSILASFLFILQNVLSVMVLQAHAAEAVESESKFRTIIKKLIRNPVVVSALAGVIVSLSQLPIPTAILRFLDIMGGLAPPMSLLLIGASVSLQVMRKNFFSVLGSVVLKIIGLPIFGFVIFKILQVDVADYLPSMILLATPTATVAYILSKEMHGDAEFTSAAISTSTLCSAFTYLVWLSVVS